MQRFRSFSVIFESQQLLYAKIAVRCMQQLHMKPQHIAQQSQIGDEIMFRSSRQK